MTAAVFESEEPLSRELLVECLEEMRGQLLRVKGTVDLAGESKRGFLELAGDLVTLREGEEWGDEPRRSEVVFIGEGLDDSFHFALDWDLIIRFREAGMRFERLPRFLGAFRITDTQKTSTLIRTTGEREMRKIRKRIFGRNPSGREIHRHVKAYLRRQWFYDICYKLGFSHY